MEEKMEEKNGGENVYSTTFALSTRSIYPMHL